MSDLRLRPIHLKEAKDFIAKHHRHHGTPVGHKFSIGVENGHGLAGVAVIGRPVARMADDGWTAEVTRLCTDGTPNTCSLLYGASARAAKALGYRKIITYILASEDGTSLRASGWQRDHFSKGGTWSRPSRARDNDHPLEPKVRWVRQL
jgi:hypothetical protein